MVSSGSPVAVLRIVKRGSGRVRPGRWQTDPGDTYKRPDPVTPNMRVLGVVGPETAGRSDLVERLAERLSGHGSVATVRDERGGQGPDPPSTGGDGEFPGKPTAADVVYRIAEDGWVATGNGGDVGRVIDDLAPDHDYAVLAGFPDAAVPQVELADADGTGEPLVTVDDAGTVDLDGVIAALRETEPYETLESLVARAKRSPRAERAGAIATFTGRVRARDHDEDEPTEYLEFEKYEGVAERRLDRIESELAERDGVQEVLTHHRTGRIDYGEDIVFVVVLAGHREEAFRTVEDGINRLKDEVPIFKREVTVEEEFWVHER